MMEHFVRVIFDEAVELNETLNESVFPGHQILETVEGRQVFHYGLPKQLSEEESDEFAANLQYHLDSKLYYLPNHFCI